MDVRCRLARAIGVVLERDRRAESGHDPVAGDLIDRAAISLDDLRGTIDQVGHDLAESLGSESRRDVHRMDHIGEQHRHLLVLGVTVDSGDRRSARVTEAGAVTQFGVARSARHCHGSILSPREKPRLLKRAINDRECYFANWSTIAFSSLSWASSSEASASGAGSSMPSIARTIWRPASVSDTTL